MQEFIPGQRWINNAQLEMGLGTVLKTDFRTVTVIFLATGDTFVYARESVPLTRVRFIPGDHILTHEGVEVEVLQVVENEGLITYEGKPAGSDQRVLVEESLLNNFIQLNRPTERLFNGQVDRSQWFDLRYQTRQHITRLSKSHLFGLADGRVSLIPHQLFIAHEVANRYAPRVLLADEVGLGKTIEAGMILHHQLVNERVGRVLIVVPESLTHQWLVEMLRRFNLMFKIFDESRVEGFFDENGDANTDQNPFLGEQLVLCSLEFLSSRAEVFKACRDAGWDLMVVDEAHHLDWSEDQPGFEYQLIEQLARQTPGVLLLTATPEQLGQSGHFARLRLLDAQRFPDYGQFLQEEKGYGDIADVVESIVDTDVFDDLSLGNLQRGIEKSLGEDGDLAEALALVEEIAVEDIAQESQTNGQASEQDHSSVRSARRDLVQMLLDRHGTGRVLFRNTRSAVKGFPGRQVHAYPLELAGGYGNALSLITPDSLSEPQLLLCPELLYQASSQASDPHWTKVDPRVVQLVEILKTHRPKKILVIAASAQTAVDLSEFLRVREGIQAAVFHEDMSLIDRDRAAAWFADKISGAQVLICSEIGSEGRNFQFSHHLVLFDLPLNPDLLEQRIGRLDRIGQDQTINIHVLYFKNSAQEVMFNWYQNGLSAFEQTCPAGQQVFAEVQTELVNALYLPEEAMDALVERSSAHREALMLALAQGRDRLLEFNSCRPDVAAQLAEQAEVQDQQNDLQPFLESVFDCLGVEYEVHSKQCFAIRPGSHMNAPVPGLPEEGMTVTYHRETALSYEDVTYLSWSHPLVVSVMDLIQTGEFGNTALIAAFVPGAPRGMILLESIYVLESASSQHVQSRRYLPPTTLRIMIDQQGRRYDRFQDSSSLTDSSERIKPEMVHRVLQAKQNVLRKMVGASEQFAKKMAPKMVETAQERVNALFMPEIQRLEALIKVNPNVRQQEIDFFKQQHFAVTEQIEASSIRLDALRVVLAT